MSDIDAGTDISADLFEMREAPVGLLPPAAVEGTMGVSLEAGEPLLSSHLSRQQVPVPKGWWAVELEVPPGLFPGNQVILVAGGEDPGSSGEIIEGIVVSTMVSGREFTDGALVAIPQEHLTRVSQASAYGTLTVAVAPNR
jgi:hypothetical protein